MPGPGDLAVIVCTRERAQMLDEALASIADATPPEVEIVVVDSASRTAETRDVALAHDAHYVRSDIAGLSIARNIGLASTDRRFVLFTDDDCLAVDGWVTGVLDHFASSGVGAVTGRMLDHTLEGDDLAPTVRLTRAIQGIDAGHGAFMAFHRERTIALGGFDEVLGAGRRLAGAEDLDMLCRVLRGGYAVVHDQSIIVRHNNTRQGGAYTELHRGYGLGLGALSNKWVRMSPPTGVAMLAIFLRRTLVRLLRFRRDPRRRAADRAMLSGILGGFWAGARLRRVGDRFVDAHPPEPRALLESDTGRPTRGGHDA
jgi:glycosyltransferase involved in cell wall biosynthesis